MQRQRELLHAILAIQPRRRPTYILYGRKDEANQNANDGNHDEKFNQREATMFVHGVFLRSGSRETSDAGTSRYPKSHDFDYVKSSRSGSRETSDAMTSRYPKSHDFDYIKSSRSGSCRNYAITSPCPSRSARSCGCRHLQKTLGTG